MSDKIKPEVINDGYLKANIWTNEGKNGTYRNTTITKTYKDEHGEYHDGQNLDQTDLLKLPELARRAYNRVNELKELDYQNSRQKDQNVREDQGRDAFKEKRTQQPQEHQIDRTR